MPIFDVFSRRRRRKLKAGTSDPYQYDVFPETFRKKVVHCIVNTLGGFPTNMHYEPRAQLSLDAWMLAFRTVSEEMGTFVLGERRDNEMQQYISFLLAASPEQFLDAVEIVFNIIDTRFRRTASYARSGQSPDDAIAILNARFEEYGLGYFFHDGHLHRRDAEFLHHEAIMPALGLLTNPQFAGAEDEFLKAHEHYRAARFEDAMVWALKAFESTMRIICDERRWTLPPTATASALIDLIFGKGLLPAHLVSEFSALRATLESGLPTVRNKQAGHGQGATVRTVPDYLAAYALHLAAANILLLVKAHDATP